MGLTPAERLLQELGVTEPTDIDLEAIAYYSGARVRTCPLDGCEARIIGVGNQAIITVNAHSSPRRKRFSIAHELGHWKHHRGQSLVCRVDDYRPDNRISPERIADRYAADLLMPPYLFSPEVKKHGKLTFKAVAALADAFDTSLTSTAIRAVEANHSPAVLVCHGQTGRRWFTRAPIVPARWFPRDTLDAESFAMSVLYSQKSDIAFPRKIGADAWFDRREAERYEVLEQSVRTAPEEVLTLILLTDAGMLDEEETWGDRRK
jgi:hypothetical protein